MKDRFLQETCVSDEQDAMRETRKAALCQRQNTVYSRPEIGNERSVFRDEIAKLLRFEAQRYTQPTLVTDASHCEAIRRISEDLSTRFGSILKNKRFRYGTSQKAFNLYLKFLWRLGLLGEGKPPHCPADGTMLEAAGIFGKSWTWSDDEQEYVEWIDAMKKAASPLDLADWEYQRWRPQISKTRKCA